MISEAEMKAIEARAKDKYKNFYPHAAGPREEGYCTGAVEQREVMLEREKVLLEKAIMQNGTAFSIQKALIDGIRDAIWVLVDNSEANANSIAVEKLESAYAKYEALKAKL